MKKITFLLLSIFLSLYSIAQTAVPITVTSTNPSKMGLWERVTFEGIMPAIDNSNTYPTGYVFGSSTPKANGGTLPNSNSFLCSYTNNIGYALYVKNVYLWASAPCLFSIVINPTKILKVVAGPSGYTREINEVCYSKQNFNIVNLGLIDTTGTSKILSIGSAEAYSVSSTLNYQAKKTIVWKGDSNSAGSNLSLTQNTDPTISLEDLASTKLMNYYNSVSGGSSDCRIILKALPGQGSSYFETLRVAGQMAFVDPPDMIVYHLGTNDGNATVLGTNITNELTTDFKKYPKTKVLVLGTIPEQGGLGETQQALNRTAAANAVSTFQSANPSFASQTAFINCGLAWSVSDNTKYSNTESPGSGIHQNVSGQLAEAIYIIANLPTNFLKL